MAPYFRTQDVVFDAMETNFPPDDTKGPDASLKALEPG